MKRFLPAFLTPVMLCATTFEEKPWFGQFCEFNWRAQYSYSFFDKVDRALTQLPSTSHDHLVATGLQLTAPETWNWQLEMDFFNSPRSDWGWRSAAFSARKLFCDDVCGDPISLTGGLTIRAVSKRMLKDVSVPFHARGNFELHTALGKEWSKGCTWQWRIWGLGALGMGTRGLPWVRTDLYFLGNWCDRHQWRLFARGYFGLGRKDHVDIQDFNGYGNIAHRSIDLGGSWKILCGIWGSLRFDYSHRVFARAFPEHLNAFTITYDLPFSVL